MLSGAERAPAIADRHAMVRAVPISVLVPVVLGMLLRGVTLMGAASAASAVIAWWLW